MRESRRLPESVSAEEISDFLADLGTYRDRVIVLLMALGGLRAAEVRSLRLADVDMGLRRVRVMGFSSSPAGCTPARSFSSFATVRVDTA